MFENEGSSYQVRTVLLVLSVCVLVALADQGSKFLVTNSLSPGQVVPVIPGFFNLTLLFNPGAAFGLMSGLPNGLRQGALGVTTILALVCVLYLLFKEYRRDRLGQTALAMILGGAAGNLIDRFTIGQVVDFLDFYLTFIEPHYPAFNLADSAICLGVFVLLFRQPFGRRRSK